MKIAVGSDHGGFLLKQEVARLITSLGHEVLDMGCYNEDSVDYPDYADKVVAEIEAGRGEKGVLVCGTGIGMSIAANRSRKIRAALCHDLETTRLSREHNDANILCMGGRVLDTNLALSMVKLWLATAFTDGRHQRRIDKMS
ncbi:MAG: ribose 5-phosphate isomerase B [Desulforhopalus sp.]|nr:ribose 5-phosphate isomerase B [Desulforhopalus sp.]